MALNKISTMSYSQSNTSNPISFDNNRTRAILAAGWETSSQKAAREGTLIIPDEMLPHAIWIDILNQSIVRCPWSGSQTFMNPTVPPPPYQSTQTVTLQTQQSTVTPQSQQSTVTPQSQQSASISNFLGLSVPSPASTPTPISTPTPTTIVISDDDSGNNNLFTTHNSGHRGRTRDQSSRSRSRGSSSNTKPRRSRRRARSVDQASQGRNRRQQTTYTVFAGIPDDVRNVD